MDPVEISYVLPAYNEQDNIALAVEEAEAALSGLCRDWEIIAVDDGSRDRTPEILAGLAAKNPRVRVLTIRPNRGYTNALRSGFLAATKPWVFYTDADNQFDPRELGRFLEHRQDADLVIGYRADRKDSGLRKWLSGGYNAMQRRILGLGVRDINCAFKLFRRPFFDVAPIESDGFLIDAEMLVRAHRLGLRLIELPVGHHARARGQTTVRWTTVFETLKAMRRLVRLLDGWPPAELKRRVENGGLAKLARGA